MTVLQAELQARPRGLTINVAAMLIFGALAVLILNPIFGSLSALGFLACGLALIGLRPRASLNHLLTYWYVLILPAYCLASILWSQFPAVTLRHGLQLAITVAIAVVIANRISPVMLMRYLFGIYGIGVVGSLLFGRVRDDIGAWVGIFGSKNAFAAVISVFILTSFAVLIDKSSPRLMRLAAAGGLAVSGPLLVLAQSTGAIIVLLVALTIAVLIFVSRRVSRVQRIVLTCFGLLVCALVAIFLNVYGDALFSELLDYSGKDTTLTGRTDLWEYGRHLISQNPLLGVGYQAFWVRGFNPAEALWADFGIQARSGFNFHNTYISNGVEIGIVGLVLQIAILLAALLLNLVWAFRSPSPANGFYASFMVMVVGASFVEVAVFFQFSVTSILVICALIYGVQADAAWKAWISSFAGRSDGRPAYQPQSPAYQGHTS